MYPFYIGYTILASCNFNVNIFQIKGDVFKYVYTVIQRKR